MGIKFLNEDNQLNPQELWRTGAPNTHGIHDVREMVITSMTSEVYGYKHPRSKM